MKYIIYICDGLLFNSLLFNFAKVGKSVAKNDPLLKREVMNMETTLYATKDAIVEKVQDKTGDKVKSKDLLIEFKA